LGRASRRSGPSRQILRASIQSETKPRGDFETALEWNRFGSGTPGRASGDIKSVRGPIGLSRCTGRTAMDTGVRGHETNALSARIFWTVVACMLMAAPAEGDEPSQDKSRANPRPAIDSGPGRKPSDPEAPGPRSFRLGFTPDDLLSTPEVSKTVYETLSKHADLVAFHIGLGVPWEEALSERPFPPAVEQYLAR